MSAMQFVNEFTLDAPADELFNALADVERVVPCLPGAQLHAKLSARLSSRLASQFTGSRSSPRSSNASAKREATAGSSGR